jgi:hypothetical protein
MDRMTLLQERRRFPFENWRFSSTIRPGNADNAASKSFPWHAWVNGESGAQGGGAGVQCRGVSCSAVRLDAHGNAAALPGRCSSAVQRCRMVWLPSRQCRFVGPSKDTWPGLARLGLGWPGLAWPGVAGGGEEMGNSVGGWCKARDASLAGQPLKDY